MTYQDKYKHMNEIDRKIIESMLDQDEKRKDIAFTLNRSESTISKEILKRRTLKKVLNSINNFNSCKDRYNCNIKNLCGKCFKHDKCAFCNLCNEKCPLYKDDTCKRLLRYPYVCNGCTSKKGCRNPKFYYTAKQSQIDYEVSISKPKQLIKIDSEAFKKMDEIFTQGVLKGQSPYHIKMSNPKEIPYSLSHLYWLNSHGRLSTKNIDFARIVKRKVPKAYKRRNGSTIKQEFRQTRTYKHYLDFIEANGDIRTVQMDTVIGERTKGKVLLTLFFLETQFLLIYIMEEKKAESVVSVFDKLEALLGIDTFKQLFPCLLTDNGTEFSDVLRIEYSAITGEKRTNLFFCDPSNSNQKSQIEKSHHFIREILPKSKNFNYLTQDKVEIMTSNINSIKRASLNGKTPFEIMEFLFTSDLLATLGLKLIIANEVILKPRIVK